MEGTEIEGKSIDEAIEKACRTLQVPREKLKHRDYFRGKLRLSRHGGGKKP